MGPFKVPPHNTFFLGTPHVGLSFFFSFVFVKCFIPIFKFFKIFWEWQMLHWGTNSVDSDEILKVMEKVVVKPTKGCAREMSAYSEGHRGRTTNN